MGVNAETMRNATEELGAGQLSRSARQAAFPRSYPDANGGRPRSARDDRRLRAAASQRICALALDIDQRSLERGIREAGIRQKRMIWRDVRGLWDLPETYEEYHQLLGEKEKLKERGKGKRRRGGRSRARRKTTSGIAAAQST